MQTAAVTMFSATLVPASAHIATLTPIPKHLVPRPLEAISEAQTQVCYCVDVRTAVIKSASLKKAPVVFFPFK